MKELDFNRLLCYIALMNEFAPAPLFVNGLPMAILPQGAELPAMPTTYTMESSPAEAFKVCSDIGSIAVTLALVEDEKITPTTGLFGLKPVVDAEGNQIMVKGTLANVHQAHAELMEVAAMHELNQKMNRELGKLEKLSTLPEDELEEIAEDALVSHELRVRAREVLVARKAKQLVNA